jgi:hypothetical protein
MPWVVARWGLALQCAYFGGAFMVVLLVFASLCRRRRALMIKKLDTLFEDSI